MQAVNWYCNSHLKVNIQLSNIIKYPSVKYQMNRFSMGTVFILETLIIKLFFLNFQPLEVVSR